MPQTFTIIIIGAGIAGLCAGIGLAKVAGHKVIILESAHELSPVGAGIHIPPNATLVLQQWGVLDRFEKFASVPSGFAFRRYADSSILARSIKNSPKDGEVTTPYWSMKRADYQQVLLELALEAGCDIRLGQRVTAIDEDLPSVTTSGGESHEADLVIIADGIKSSIRPLLFPNEDVSPVLQPLSTYRAWALRSDFSTTPDLAALFETPVSNVWIGPSRHVIIYPADNNRILNINGTYPSRHTTAGAWNAPASISSIQSQFASFDPCVLRILSKARDAKSWALAEVPRLTRWMSTSRKVVLIGDAAHGMLQFLAQGAAMATEDAAALTECIRRTNSTAEIPHAMHVLERARKWRCEKVQANARRSGEMVHMPDGEEQETRDRKMRGESREGDGEVDVGPFLDRGFGEWLFGYDAVRRVGEVWEECKGV